MKSPCYKIANSNLATLFLSLLFGEEAMKESNRFCPDLVILDIQLKRKMDV